MKEIAKIIVKVFILNKIERILNTISGIGIFVVVVELDDSGRSIRILVIKIRLIG